MSDMTRMVLFGDKAFTKYVFKQAVLLDPLVEKLVHTATELTNTRIKANASGRPGPNAPTGDYRRSWVTSYAKAGGTFTGTAGTNKPQGRRLEFGFHGPDSLGRVYNQPPYPHVGPAFEWGSNFLKSNATTLMRQI